MTRRDDERLLVSEIKSISSAPVALLRFRQPYEVISIELDLGYEPECRDVIGSEGMSCELFLDENRKIYAVDLTFSFFLVDVAPMDLLEPIRSSMRAMAKPAELELIDFPHGAINADAIWFFTPFGGALFSFDHFAIAPTEVSAAAIHKMEFFEIGGGVIIGTEYESGKVRTVLTEGFDRHQQIFGAEFTENVHGPKFLDILGSIHIEYYKDVEPLTFYRFADDAIERLRDLIADIDKNRYGDIDSLEQLVSSYKSNIEFENLY